MPLQLSKNQAVAVAIAGFLGVSFLLGAFILSNTTFVIRNLGVSADGRNANAITTKGTGETYAQPDTASFSVTAREEASTTALAADAANKKINQVKDILKKYNIPAKDIQTSSATYYPKYSYADGRSKVVAQTASQTLSVKIRDVDSTASLVAKVFDEVSGVNNVSLSSLAFTLEDDSKALESARNEAFAEAKAKAEQLAKLGGISLLTPISIDEAVSGGSTPTYYYGRAEVDAAAGDSKTTTVNPGEVRLNVVVTVVYGIK